MTDYTMTDFLAAKRAIDSLLSKCMKVEPKLKPGSSQHSLIRNRIKALEISAQLLDEKLLLFADFQSSLDEPLTKDHK